MSGVRDCRESGDGGDVAEYQLVLEMAAHGSCIYCGRAVVDLCPSGFSSPTSKPYEFSNMSPTAIYQAAHPAHTANIPKPAEQACHQDITKLESKPIDRIWLGDTSGKIKFPGIPEFDDKLQQREWVKVRPCSLSPALSSR
jgi:hypothetical protein